VTKPLPVSDSNDFHRSSFTNRAPDGQDATSCLAINIAAKLVLGSRYGLGFNDATERRADFTTRSLWYDPEVAFPEINWTAITEDIAEIHFFTIKVEEYFRDLSRSWAIEGDVLIGRKLSTKMEIIQ